MNCRKVNHLLSAYMDGELPGIEHRLIHEHLLQCSECHQDYEGLLRTKRLVARLRMQEPRPEMSAHIVANLQSFQQRRAGDPLGSLWNDFIERVRDFADSGQSVAIGAGLAVMGVVMMINKLDALDDSKLHLTGTLPMQGMALALPSAGSLVSSPSYSESRAANVFGITPAASSEFSQPMPDEASILPPVAPFTTKYYRVPNILTVKREFAHGH